MVQGDSDMWATAKEALLLAIRSIHAFMFYEIKVNSFVISIISVIAFFFEVGYAEEPKAEDLEKKR